MEKKKEIWLVVHILVGKLAVLRQRDIIQNSKFILCNITNYFLYMWERDTG